MLEKIQVEEYNSIKQLHYKIISKYPLINSVISGIQKGFVYTNTIKDTIFIVTKSGFSFFYSLNENLVFYQECFDFMKNNMEIPNYIHFYSPSVLFLDFIKGEWDKYKIRQRIQYQYLQKRFDLSTNLLPANYKITTIQDIPFRSLDIFNLNLDSRYWDSESDFNKNAIGACILNEKEIPAAICYSACVVDMIAEMDTVVLPEYRGKGFMKIVSEPYYNIAKEKKFITHWDTFVSNIASYKMGKNFEPDSVCEYDFLSVLLR